MQLLLFVHFILIIYSNTHRLNFCLFRIMSIITFPIESNDIDIDKNKTNYCEKCNTLTRMQIKLRQCQHTICVKCALLYLKVCCFLQFFSIENYSKLFYYLKIKSKKIYFSMPDFDFFLS